ncbi:MAG TPA: prefoldin subunit alpha [Candidatus Omnitrophota bacterium]|nr:prefoldin subunit alpha [Candidatus Omnitrophota bacterium]
MAENQEIVFKLSMFEQQIQQLQQQYEAVERGLIELQSLHLNLDEIPNSIDKEIFAQIGKGIYVKAKIISDKLIVNVGENNFVNRDVPEAKKLIEEQIKKLNSIKTELEDNIELTNKDFAKLIEEYRKSQSQI